MIICKNCNSVLCSIESDGKKQSYKCNSCGFIGKSSKLRGVAELYFLLGIGYDISRHTEIENITIKIDAPSMHLHADIGTGKDFSTRKWSGGIKFGK